MAQFWGLVNKVIEDADILLMVLDARMAEDTRNLEIENKIKDKPLLFVINKCDLVDKHVSEQLKKKIPNSIFVSSKDYHGLKILKERIMITASRLKLETVKVGVLGYPNVGKSSLINAFSGKSAAGVSSMSGHTKSIMKVSARDIKFLDTPGVIPYKEKNETKHGIIGTIDHTKEKDPEFTVLKIIETFPGVIEKYYGTDQDEEILEVLAKKYSLLKKGGKPDTERMARKILQDWQKGLITSKQ